MNTPQIEEKNFARHISLSAEVWRIIEHRKKRSLRSYGAEIEILLRQALKDVGELSD
jgi:hypothetical protein|tara:strand:+ start:806 stop:976 length:171 start_codon:yes stop_codon:yes gene_type:complete